MADRLGVLLKLPRLYLFFQLPLHHLHVFLPFPFLAAVHFLTGFFFSEVGPGAGNHRSSLATGATSHLLPFFILPIHCLKMNCGRLFSPVQIYLSPITTRDQEVVVVDPTEPDTDLFSSPAI